MNIAVTLATVRLVICYSSACFTTIKPRLHCYWILIRMRFNSNEVFLQINISFIYQCKIYVFIMLLENLQTDIFLTLASYFVFLLCCVATTLFSFKLTHYLIMGYIVKNKKYDYLFKIKIKDNHFFFINFDCHFVHFLLFNKLKSRLIHLIMTQITLRLRLFRNLFCLTSKCETRCSVKISTMVVAVCLHIILFKS